MAVRYKMLKETFFLFAQKVGQGVPCEGKLKRDTAHKGIDDVRLDIKGAV